MSYMHYEQAPLVILANSRKPGGRCVAGKVYEDDRAGKWIRPVSERPGQELNSEERRLEDDSEPELLDVLEMSIGPRVERPRFQIENRALGPTSRGWKKLRRVNLQWIRKHALDYPKTLWENGCDPKNSRVPQDVVENRAGAIPSLYLIEAKHLFVDKHKNREAWYGAFYYRRMKYKLRITDPVVEGMLSQGKMGDRLSNVVLCLSLGDAHRSDYVDDGKRAYHYKLIAGVLWEGRFK